MNKSPVVIVDIDGTLADVRHRLHHIRGRKKNWHGFFEAMDADLPITGVLRWVQNLAPEYRVVIVTGRPDHYRERTENWLRRHGVRYEELFMRPQGDHRADYVVKAEVLSRMNGRIAFAIDDRPLVCRMWRRNGIRCFPIPSDAENRQVNEVYRRESEGRD